MSISAIRPSPATVHAGRRHSAAVLAALADPLDRKRIPWRIRPFARWAKRDPIRRNVTNRLTITNILQAQEIAISHRMRALTYARASAQVTRGISHYQRIKALRSDGFERTCPPGLPVAGTPAPAPFPGRYDYSEPIRLQVSDRHLRTTSNQSTCSPPVTVRLHCGQICG